VCVCVFVCVCVCVYRAFVSTQARSRLHSAGLFLQILPCVAVCCSVLQCVAA